MLPATLRILTLKCVSNRSNAGRRWSSQCVLKLTKTLLFLKVKANEQQPSPTSLEKSKLSRLRIAMMTKLVEWAVNTIFVEQTAFKVRANPKEQFKRLRRMITRRMMKMTRFMKRNLSMSQSISKKTLMTSTSEQDRSTREKLYEVSTQKQA